MKLSSDAAVRRIIAEGITDFDVLADFDKKSIQLLPQVCRQPIPEILADVANGIQAEVAVAGANISTISVRRLIIASDAVRYYRSINRTLSADRLHYENVLSGFKLEWEAYQDLVAQDEPKVPKVADNHVDRKVIKWIPIFLDCLSRTYGPLGPLRYVLRDDPDVPDEADDPLEVDDTGTVNAHFGTSGSLMDEMIKRLPHTGAIFKNDNKTVYMKIEEAVRGTSVESTVKTFAARRDGRGAFLALVANHAGDTKYRSISKKRMNHLQNIKWNGRAYPLESHVSNHRQAVDDLRECSDHITVTVPNDSQRVEYLLDSITCQDASLQAAIGIVRANTNNMRHNFELAAASLIEVDPYKRSQRAQHTSKSASISSIDFSAGRGKTGVDLRWHPKSEFNKLSNDKKDELIRWQKTADGRKAMKASRKAAADKRKGDWDDATNHNSGKSGKSWKAKFKKALKTNDGVKTIMATLAEEEKCNAALIAALKTATQEDAHKNKEISSTHTQFQPPPAQTGVTSNNPTISAVANALPATTTMLSSILKNSKSS